MTTKLLAVLVLAVVGCTASVAEPEPEDDCLPPDEPVWCHHLDNDAVRDSIIPLPPDTTTH